MQLLKITKPEPATAKDTRPFKRVSVVRRKRPDWDDCERGGYRNIGQTEERFSRFIKGRKNVRTPKSS